MTPTLIFALALSGAKPAPIDIEAFAVDPQTLVYFNARVALREGRHRDVLRLWLLRNALRSRGVAPVHDGDFRSVVWASLAGAGLCQDGFPTDEDEAGAGLWPLALHNWLVRSSSKQPAPGQPPPFDSFTTGYQQRFISLHDVLSREELEGVRFFRRDCLVPYIALARLPTLHWLDLQDRLSVGIVMRDLIVLARDETLKHDRVETAVVLETRLFDLDLALAKLAKSKARRESGILAEIAKATGVSESATVLTREKQMALVRASEHTELLRESLSWTPTSWFSLSHDRRIALFAETEQPRAAVADPELAAARERTLLQNIDVLIERKDGDELSLWLGFAGEDDAELLAKITDGARGERLLGLERETTGFRERSVIALRRGTRFLRQGKELEAMRSFALAMKHSNDARQADVVHNLSKRWFAYVLAHYRADDEVLAILKAFVPPTDRNDLLEILLWRAAFHADLKSFDRAAKEVRRRGALDRRMKRLRLLARGDPGAMWTEASRELGERPSALYNFVKRVTDELALEPLDVRTNNRATLELGEAALARILPKANRGLTKRVAAVQLKIQTLLDGLAQYDASAEGRARAAAPGYESYAGSVRLAPADPMPWPFAEPGIEPPTPFAPIKLTPVERSDSGGDRVFHWRVHE